MSLARFLKNGFRGTAFALIISLSAANAGPIGTASFKGAPVAGLPSSVYEPIDVKRLAHAKVLWVNYDILRELGFSVEKGLTPELEEMLLDHFAYAVDDGSRPSDRFLPKVLRWFSDRYGGRGMNGNLGSARAGSTGLFNIKGFGATPMLGPGADPYHRSGRVSGFDSAKEALWSQVLDHEAPHGAVRSFLVIATGEGQEALQVREDPTRPAHFLTNLHAQGDDLLRDQNRLQDTLAVLADHFPLPPGTFTPDPIEKLKFGSRYYIDSVAEQYGFTDANRFYQGAASASNVGIDGRLLDLASFTALEGYPPVNQADLKPFGSQEPVQKEMVWEFIRELKQKLPPDRAAALPTLDETWHRYEEKYLSRFSIEMVKQTGAPGSWIEKLSERSEVRDLGKILREIAFEGPREQIKVYGSMPGKVMTYDPRSILEQLGKHPFSESAVLERILEPEIGNRELRKKLARAYHGFAQLMIQEGAQERIDPSCLETYWRETSSLRNLDRTDLYRRDSQSNALGKALTSAIEGTPRNQNLQAYLDKVVERNQRVFPDADPLVAVLSAVRNPREGTELRRVYDARQGAYSQILRVHTPPRSVNILGLGLDLEELKNSTLFAINGLGSDSSPARSASKGDYTEYILPDLTPGQTQALELRLENGKSRNLSLQNGLLSVSKPSNKKISPAALKCVLMRLKAK